MSYVSPAYALGFFSSMPLWGLRPVTQRPSDPHPPKPPARGGRAPIHCVLLKRSRTFKSRTPTPILLYYTYPPPLFFKIFATLPMQLAVAHFRLTPLVGVFFIMRSLIHELRRPPTPSRFSEISIIHPIVQTPPGLESQDFSATVGPVGGQVPQIQDWGFPVATNANK